MGDNNVFGSKSEEYLHSIAKSLEIIAKASMPKTGPSYRRTLTDFWSFDWGSNDAKIIDRDPGLSGMERCFTGA